MEIIIDGNPFNIETDIIPGEFKFDNIKQLSDDDFVKTLELDPSIIGTNDTGGDTE